LTHQNGGGGEENAGEKKKNPSRRGKGGGGVFEERESQKSPTDSVHETNYHRLRGGLRKVCRRCWNTADRKPTSQGSGQEMETETTRANGRGGIGRKGTDMEKKWYLHLPAEVQTVAEKREKTRILRNRSFWTESGAAATKSGQRCGSNGAHKNWTSSESPKRKD